MHKISIQKQRQILDLTFEGKSIRSIAKKTKVNWRTARKYKDRFDLEIEQAEKEIYKKTDDSSLSDIIKKLLHL